MFLLVIDLFRREETVFFFDVQATPGPLHITKQENVPFFGRERCVFVFLCSKKIASGHTHSHPRSEREFEFGRMIE
jgi:hypothetical protein